MNIEALKLAINKNITSMTIQNSDQHAKNSQIMDNIQKTIIVEHGVIFVFCLLIIYINFIGV